MHSLQFSHRKQELSKSLSSQQEQGRRVPDQNVAAKIKKCITFVIDYKPIVNSALT